MILIITIITIIIIIIIIIMLMLPQRYGYKNNPYKSVACLLTIIPRTSRFYCQWLNN